MLTLMRPTSSVTHPSMWYVLLNYHAFWCIITICRLEKKRTLNSGNSSSKTGLGNYADPAAGSANYSSNRWMKMIGKTEPRRSRNASRSLRSRKCSRLNSWSRRQSRTWASWTCMMSWESAMRRWEDLSSIEPWIPSSESSRKGSLRRRNKRSRSRG